MKKEEELITSFIWCGATVCVYTQVVKLAGTTIQRHLLPNHLRNAVNSAVQDAENIPHSDPTNNKPPRRVREGANKQVISSQADSLIKISRIWADFFPANTSNQPI